MKALVMYVEEQKHILVRFCKDLVSSSTGCRSGNFPRPGPNPSELGPIVAGLILGEKELNGLGLQI